MNKTFMTDQKSVKDILSDIKTEMVSNDDQILDLTEFVEDSSVHRLEEQSSSEDVLKVGNNQLESDVNQFLSLIKKNEKNLEEDVKISEVDVPEVDQVIPEGNSKSENSCKEKLLETVIKDALYPILDRWVEANLPKVVSKIVEEKIDQIFKKI